MTVELHLGDCKQKTLTETHKRNISDAHKKRTDIDIGAYFNCVVCGKQFWRKPSAIKNGDCKFCSRDCYFVWQKGRARSEQFKEKCKGKSGSNNPNWKGGITPENKRLRESDDFANWRKAVFERDGYTCQKCGAKCGNGINVTLAAHHIKPFAKYPELRFDVDNGLTLCNPCHSLEPKGKAIWSL